MGIIIELSIQRAADNQNPSIGKTNDGVTHTVLGCKLTK